MKQMQFSVDLQASSQRVWETLWQDETFRQWAGVIDPGTFMVGELKEGGEVQFISAENGYGVTSLVERLDEGKYLVLKHQADTKKHGAEEREKEWTGGQESYTLIENNGITTLTAAFDVPVEMEEYFSDAYPRAFETVKSLAEATND